MDELNNQQDNTNSDSTNSGNTPNEQNQAGNTSYQQPQYEQPKYSGESQYQQTNNQYQYNQSYNEYDSPKQFDTLGLLSLIFGCVSFVFGCCLFYITWATAIAAIVLGILSIKNNKVSNKAMAIIGIVFGSLALLLVIIVVFSLAFKNASNGLFSGVSSRYY